MLYLLFALILFLTILMLIVYWRRIGFLTKQRFAFILSFYWGLFMLSVILIFGPLTWQNIAIGSGLALFQFMVSYFVGLWSYSIFFK